MLVSVFDRFDGKTPSRGVCDAIARAFTRSPVRDPTRRALARERPDDALAIKTRAAAPVAAAVPVPAAPAVGANPWRAIDDGKGNIYYYNALTGVSQWEKPDWFA